MGKLILTLILSLALLSLASDARDRKNGFDVSNASIPIKEILSGGPPRDGIPSIDNPRFVSASAADFLRDKDRVIGLALGGIAKAYPIAILNWHEIVNDSLAGEPVVVTFCPLCGTGMVFRVPASLDFGVSGLLYNSDVLLYDRQSDSLWSQIKMEAVSGRRLGEKLELLPASHTTWADWRKRHPDTRVLSTRTGVTRDYRQDPYAGYSRSRDLYFPVTNRSKRYHPKEQVIGVRLAGNSWVWPFSELAKSSGSVSTQLNGETVEVRYNTESRSGGVFREDNSEIPSTVAYWFAWMSFYPDSEVFSAPK